MKKGLAFALLLAFMLAACDKEEKQFDRSLYVNEDAVCCGVADPMHNIPWLKDFGDASQNSLEESTFTFEEAYLLFSNDTTSENKIVHVDHQPRVTWVSIYDCNGNMIDRGDYSIALIKSEIATKTHNEPAPPCDSCPQFFETHLFVDTLAYYSITLK